MLVSRLGEEALLERLRRLFEATAGEVPVAIGDDAAVIDQHPDFQMVWTTDLLLEGIHFQKEWQTPQELGRKCLAVNLSDIASMGGTPRYCLLSLACPKDTEADFIIEFCQGFNDYAAEEGVAVIGGDTTSSKEGLVLSVTAGGLVEKGKAILRSGSRPGDAIVVTGYLGSAAGGLRLLKQQADKDSYPALREAFIAPQAEVTVAREALVAGATAMTDISDGLASDLRHICTESGVGAVIDHDMLPVHEELIKAAADNGWNLDSLVLSGGEDYGLLFTIPSDRATKTASKLSAKYGKLVTVIGKIQPEPGINMNCGWGRVIAMPERGFDHFLST